MLEARVRDVCIGILLTGREAITSPLLPTAISPGAWFVLLEEHRRINSSCINQYFKIEPLTRYAIGHPLMVSSDSSNDPLMVISNIGTSTMAMDCWLYSDNFFYSIFLVETWLTMTVLLHWLNLVALQSASYGHGLPQLFFLKDHSLVAVGYHDVDLAGAIKTE